MAAGPGWYPDPSDPSSGNLRRWDGTAWTSDVRAQHAVALGSSVAPTGTSGTSSFGLTSMSAAMGDQQSAAFPPGWYDDPSGSGLQCWWDGTAWTDKVSEPAAGSAKWRQPKVLVGVAGGVVALLVAVVVLRPTANSPASTQPASGSAFAQTPAVDGSSGSSLSSQQLCAAFDTATVAKALGSSTTPTAALDPPSARELADAVGVTVSASCSTSVTGATLDVVAGEGAGVIATAAASAPSRVETVSAGDEAGVVWVQAAPGVELPMLAAVRVGDRWAVLGLTFTGQSASSFDTETGVQVGPSTTARLNQTKELAAVLTALAQQAAQVLR